MKLKRKGQYR